MAFFGPFWGDTTDPGKENQENQKSKKTKKNKMSDPKVPRLLLSWVLQSWFLFFFCFFWFLVSWVLQSWFFGFFGFMGLAILVILFFWFHGVCNLGMWVSLLGFLVGSCCTNAVNLH